MAAFRDELNTRRRYRAEMAGDVDEALDAYFDGFRIIEDAFEIMQERHQKKTRKQAEKKGSRSYSTRAAILENMRGVTWSDIILPAVGIGLLIASGAVFITLNAKND